jgi:hypothetical protein
VPVTRCELRIIVVPGHRAEQRENLVQARDANQSVYDPRQGGLWPPKQRRDKIELEQAYQAPVHGAEDNENKGNHVGVFHFFHSRCDVGARAGLTRGTFHSIYKCFHAKKRR